MENVVSDHLSRLTIAHNTYNPPINDEFHRESLLLMENAHGMLTLPISWQQESSQQTGRHKTRSSSSQKIHSYYWEEPFLYKYCADQIIKRCVPEGEQQGILSHWHENACACHFAS